MQYDKPKLEIDFSDRYPGLEMSSRDKLRFMLLSVNRALITTVVSPVVIRPIESPEVVADMYFGCLDDEDEDKAKEIMQRRVTLLGEDIRSHMTQFNHFHWLIHQINQDLLKGNYGVEKIIALTEDMIKYGLFVKTHQCNEGHFLEYPFTPGGHCEVFRDTSISRPLSFNPECSLVGLKLDSYLLHMAALDKNIRAPEKSGLFDSFAQATSELEQKLELTNKLVDYAILSIKE